MPARRLPAVPGFRAFAVALALSLLLSPAAAAPAPGPVTPPRDDPPPAADAPPVGDAPPRRPDRPGLTAVRLPDGVGYVSTGAPQAPEPPSPLATGGPDEYGYVWDDAVPRAWIDATGGTDTGMSGFSGGQAVGPIPLPFAFRYYENTYSSLYIAASGHIAFNPASYWPSGQPIPSPQPPNNVIAPYWGPLQLASSGPTGRVYYASGGTAPNRWFAAEWYQVPDYGHQGSFTFEVVLVENGNVRFEYDRMAYGSAWTCADAGIEDIDGTDGLNYGNCDRLDSYQAVLFTRPAPSARVRVTGLNQGRFTRAGALEAFQLGVRNTGEFGADTYDLPATSGWPLTRYAADGVTPLTDTDGDGLIDTGPIAQGGSTSIVVKIATPGGAVLGDDNTASLTVRSSLDTSRSRPATLQTAVPAPFAQTYTDYADRGPALDLVQPVGQTTQVVTQDYGWDAALSERPDGSLLYLWRDGRCLAVNCQVYVYEIYYLIKNRYGETIRYPTRLADNSGAAYDTYEDDVAVDVAPDGRAGIAWRRYLSDGRGGSERYNHNVYFAVIDAAGSVAYGPNNVTNNTSWGGSNDYNVPRFFDPRVAATGDNRFALAWSREYLHPANEWLDDVFYAVRGADGSPIVPVTQLTNATPDGSTYYAPALAGVAGNRFLLSWIDAPSEYRDIYYEVFASDGGVVRAATPLGISDLVPWDNHGVLPLSDGNILLAWEAWGCFPGEWVARVRYVFLDASYHRVGSPACLAAAPGSRSGTRGVGLAADGSGHAIVTAGDGYSSPAIASRLYYAALDGAGTVQTPQMIFRSARSSIYGIFPSYNGYGTTSYSWTPPAGVDGLARFQGSLFGGAPGGIAAVPLEYANRGGMVATGVVVTATLPISMTYGGDTSGVTPTIDGQNVIWSMPDLGFLEQETFLLYVGVPAGATRGTRHTILFRMGSNGPEVDPADNTASGQILVAWQLLLPRISFNRSW